MTNTPFPQVEISGRPYDRGVQYGEQTTELIGRSLSYYERAAMESSGLNWGQSTRRAMAWLPTLEEFAPDLVDEMKGTAHGAGVEFADVLMLNLRSEMLYGATFGEEEEVDACTSYSLTESATGHTYTGQNWDWRTGVADTVIMLRVLQPPKPSIIMMVEAGQLMRHGANSAGIALQSNGMLGKFGAAGLGLPQTVIRRRALEQSSLEAALRVLVESRPHVAGNNLLTHHSGFSIDIESTPKSAGWMYPDNGLLVHGNHFQASIPPQLASDYRPTPPSSLIRVDRVTQGLRPALALERPDELRETVHRTMSDHVGFPGSTCVHPPQVEIASTGAKGTLSSSLVDLTSGEYRIINGNPCQHDYDKLPWGIYDGPAEATLAS